ncbi:MAG TPA: hypothetical protein VMY34_02160 [Acidimicrobiales bacterium]|nr:hypothetical protein [Acidimicrobiales bacterium]
MFVRSLIILAVIAGGTACGDGGVRSNGSRPTSTVAARYPARASGTAEVAGPSFTGTVVLTQDPDNPSEVSPSEATIRVQLVEAANDAGARRSVSLGGAVRVGEPAKTGSTLVASYIGDGVIFTSNKGECSITVDRLDRAGVTGQLECIDVDAGGAPLTIRATFALQPAETIISTTTSPPATEPTISVP